MTPARAMQMFKEGPLQHSTVTESHLANLAEWVSRHHAHLDEADIAMLVGIGAAVFSHIDEVAWAAGRRVSETTKILS